jgi:hypothetical protein
MGTLADIDEVHAFAQQRSKPPTSSTTMPPL